MEDKHGDFVWYELMTPDVDAAQKFYGDLLGWDIEDSGMPDMDYRLASKGDAQIAGMMALSEEMTAGGAMPLWAGYVAVDDTDASLAKAKEGGANPMMEPQDIPDVGRFAMIADPQGAPIYLMTPQGEASEAFAKYDPKDGHCAWNELVTSDPDGAKGFYGDIFGWKKTDEMDMGEMGLYEMLGAGDYTLGAVMKKWDEMPAPLWIYYFRVPDIDKAVDYVGANGGQVVNGPQEIPGGEFIIQGMDPQGALFALIGKRST